jgi:glutathione S-transferase
MAEKGINDIEIVNIDVFKGDHKTDEYRARAGLPNVPALEMQNGKTITESVAICRYLEALYPEPNLFGSTPEEMGEIEMWSRRAEFLVSMPLMLTVRHSHPALAALETQNPAIAESNRAAAERSLKIFDRQLAQSAFIAADRITMADILVATAIDFARMAKFKPDPSLEHVTHWYSGMMARPTAQAGV